MTTALTLELRKLITGWRPQMTVEVRVATFNALLDLLEAGAAEVEGLRAEVAKLRGELGEA